MIWTIFIGVFLIVAVSAQADDDVIVKEHCHKEQIVTVDENGDYQVTNTGEDVCESTPNDWMKQ